MVQKEATIYRALEKGHNIAQLYKLVRNPQNESQYGYVNPHKLML